MNSPIDDRDDDIRLPGRAAERRSSMRDEAPDAAEDREFTLSTGTVLGIFFALALVCAVFFGFGYTMGRKSGQASAEAATPSAAAVSDVAASKPSPAAPAIQAIPGYLSQSEADAANRASTTQGYKATTAGNATTVVVPTATAAPVTIPPKPVKPPTTTAPAATTAMVATPPAPVERKPAEIRPAAIAAPATVAPSATTSYVQIAAVSHQEDADVLLSALKRRGYSVFARPGETDKLIHVQVGPFATRKDADTMRQKLLGDGYNAIVK